MAAQLQLLTNSRRNCFNRCPRLYQFKYELGYREVKTGDALRFGSLFHGVLELYWLMDLDSAMYWLSNQKESDYNVYEKELAKQLLIAYDRRYGEADDEIKEFAIPEKEFRAPLINPVTMAESKTFILAGKIDVILPKQKSFIEHKTTSDDISPESDYWLGLTIDGQVSGYFAGSEAEGFEANECIYDVIRKPAQRPLQATPVEKRTYKKDGTLYASQRELDESVEDYGKRLAEEIAGNPDRYFARKIITRLEDDMLDYYTDMWGCAREIRENQLANRWPRNPQMCLSWGRCPFFGVCTKTESLDDTNIFIKIDNVDQELPSAKPKETTAV